MPPKIPLREGIQTVGHRLSVFFDLNYST